VVTKLVIHPLAQLGRTWLGAGLVLALVAGCDPVDADGDGFLATSDCDDTNAGRAPDNTEICNGIDDDCDGAIDETLQTAYYADVDGDGFGDAGTEVLQCDRPEGHVTTAGDCDDSTVDIRPGAIELCNDSDDDCDGDVDEDTVQAVWYEDADGDGVGSTLIEGCERPENASDVSGDCNDADPDIGPAAVEICDGIDQNCNMLIDEGAPGGISTWADTDTDGYGDPDALFVVCSGEIPSGYVQNDADCDDSNDTIFLGAPELCDELDQDCDTVVDEDIGLLIFADADGDGFGNANSTAFSCDLPAGWSSNPFDCDDADSLAHFGATEACDGSDNDCDGTVDEDVTVRWWPDADGDSFGDDALAEDGCVPPAGVVFLGEDCNDADPLSSPIGTEVCDSGDNDCDGLTDEGLTVTWYTDADGDTFGDPDEFLEGCVIPSNGVQNGDDCNDGDTLANPAGTEVCNLSDDDCDNVMDDGVGTVYWSDADADGVGDTNGSFVRDCSLPAGYSELAGDCDDLDPTVGAGCAATIAGESPTYGVDPSRSGHQPGYLLGGVATELWSETVVGATLSAPTVADGQVFFISNGSADNLHARDLATGGVSWDLVLTSGVNVAQPTFNNNLVYAYTIGTASTELIAVNASTGVAQWGKQPGALSDLYRAPLAFSNNVYIGAGGLGGLFGYVGSNGVELWSVNGPDVDDWTPVGHDGLVWSQVGDDLLGRDPGAGTVSVAVTLPSGPTNPTRMSTVPAMEDDTALLIAGDDLVAVDLGSASISWTIANGFSGSPTLADGLGYVVHSGAVWQIDPSDSYVVREFVGDGLLAGKPLVTDDVLVVGSPSANWVFDLSTGAVLYVLEAGELAIAEDMAVITKGAEVTAFGL
jgi:PQQ-like domain/Putative metal-binding motif